MNETFDNTAWIYKNEQGEIHLVRIVMKNEVYSVLVSDISEEILRRNLHSLYDLKAIYVVEVQK